MCSESTLGTHPWCGFCPLQLLPLPTAQASTPPGHLKVQTPGQASSYWTLEYGVNQVLSCYCCLRFTGNEAPALDFPSRRQEIKLINLAERWKIPYGKRGWGWECCVCTYVCVYICVYICVCVHSVWINMEPLERSEQRCRELRGAWRSQDLGSSNRTRKESERR